MEELKDFFVRNNAIKMYNRFDLYIGDYYELVLIGNSITIVDIETKHNIIIVEPTIDRVKALIYGLTGKQLE